MFSSLLHQYDSIVVFQIMRMSLVVIYCGCIVVWCVVCINCSTNFPWIIIQRLFYLLLFHKILINRSTCDSTTSPSRASRTRRLLESWSSRPSTASFSWLILHISLIATINGLTTMMLSILNFYIRPHHCLVSFPDVKTQRIWDSIYLF